MTEADNEKGHIAILVVHGIGAQQPGETVGKLLAGLGRVGRDVISSEADGALTIGGQPVRIYEVYWADLLKGDNTIGAFQMKELQSLSWFPWLNWRRGNYRGQDYSFVKLAWWCLALPVINFLVLFAYYGAGWIVDIVYREIVKRKASEPPSTEPSTEPTPPEKSVKRSPLDRILDEYLGDIFSYVNSAGKAFYRDEYEPPVPSGVLDVYTAIVQRFYDQLVRAQAQGCAAIQIVAHSLGTVVTYHALAGLRFESSGREDAEAILTASGKVQHVYTIGSPLEKIKFFWPRLMPERATLGQKAFPWDNFVSWFDPVAGTLRSFRQWGSLRNRRLLGGGFFRGHIVYERSPVFLRTFVQGLLGRELSLEPPRKEWWQDRLILLGETLIAPVVLAVVLIIGAALVALTAILVPYLISLLLRLFLPPETWVPIVDITSLFFLGSMTLALLIAPRLRAGKVHSLFWVIPSSPRTSPGR